MKRVGAAAVVLLALWPASASAWQRLGWVASCEAPVQWALYRDPQGLAERYEAAIIATFDAWSSEEACHRFEYQGIVSGEPEMVSKADGISMVSLGDPLSALSRVVVASALHSTGSHVLVHQDIPYFGAVESDIVFGTAASLVSIAELDEACSGAIVIEALLGREIGKLLGLGDACASPDSCTPAQRAAAMHWPPKVCSAQGAVPTTDDLEGLLPLYQRAPGLERAVSEAAPSTARKSYPLQGAGSYLHPDEVEGWHPPRSAEP